MTTYNKNASHSFAFLPDVNLKRNVFNRSHDYKTAFNSGYMIPILCDEIIPGDTVNLNSADLFVRINNLITPIMDNAYLECFAYFVPNRLVWENFKAFMGEQLDPTSSTDYTVPTITVPSGGFPYESVADYLGLPAGVNLGSNKINALPFRAINLCFNEWHRDENLQNSLIVERGDGPDNYSNYPLFRRGKRHDYFTSSLPWPQKGEQITMPLGKTANVIGSGTPWVISSTNSPSGSSVGIAQSTDGGAHLRTSNSGAGAINTVYFPTNPTNGNVGLVADLSTASSSSVTQLRQSIQLQAFNELNARGGTRYTEIVMSHFGVRSPDGRLQRPELLAVSSEPLNINIVPQTSSTNTESPQANLAAFGTFRSSKLSFTKSFTEHGFLIIFANIRADLTYQQGIDRMWSRQTKYDFYWPLLSVLSEQSVLNKEIYAQGNSADDEVFGYQERYAEYRYFPSKITGKLRSSYSQSLDVWHLAQEFTSLPKLNSEFIEDNPPFKRVLAVQDEPEFVADIHFDYECVRPIPLFGIPASFRSGL